MIILINNVLYVSAFCHIYTEGCKSRYRVLLCITLITVYLLLHPSVYIYIFWPVPDVF